VREAAVVKGHGGKEVEAEIVVVTEVAIATGAGTVVGVANRVKITIVGVNVAPTEAAIAAEVVVVTGTEVAVVAATEVVVVIVNVAGAVTEIEGEAVTGVEAVIVTDETTENAKVDGIQIHLVAKMPNRLLLHSRQ